MHTFASIIWQLGLYCVAEFIVRFGIIVFRITPSETRTAKVLRWIVRCLMRRPGKLRARAAMTVIGMYGLFKLFSFKEAHALFRGQNQMAGMKRGKNG